MLRALRLVASCLCLGVALAGCEDATPFGDVLDVDGVYVGTWTLSWATNNPNVNPPGVTATCPGSLTLGDQRDDRFGGTFIVQANGDCLDGSPVSGEVIEGRVRTDGGINFTMRVPPTTGEIKLEDDIWEDIFAGSGVILPDLIVGCVIVDADNQMNGGITVSSVNASASASLSCPGGFVQLQIRFRSP